MLAEVARRVWDVAVVGAGPAGSVVARELARRGAAVLLIDKATFPRTKVCGCCLNRAALAALAAVGLGHAPEACGAVPLGRVKLAAGRRSADVPLPGGVSLSREAFDAALIEEAVAAGVAFLPGTTVKLGQADRDTRQLVLHRGSEVAAVSARVVVAANGLAGQGAESPVVPGSRLGAGVVAAKEIAPAYFVPGTIYMAAGRGGYVGLVRLEDDRLDVAAAFDPAFVRASGGLGAAAGTILAQTGWPAPAGIEGLPWKGTPALTRRPATVAGHRLFAVGDAAGYVEPFTGEGMAWAVASAAALAPIARRAADRWDDRLAREWQLAHARIVGRRQRFCRLVARVLRSPALTGFAVRAASAFPVLSRPVVAALNRPAVLHLGSTA